MKASEAYQKIVNELGDIELTYWGNERSKVDETKTLYQMLEEWKIYFRLNPDIQVRAILKYNVQKDFPAVFSDKKIESEKV